MIARVRAGFDKVLHPCAMEYGCKTGRHGMVHPPVACPGGFHDRPGRFPCPVWRLEASCLPVRFRAGTRALLMRPQSAGFPNGSKTRIRRTGCGVEQFPCRRRARQHPISCAGWGSSPTPQQWEEFPESPRAALAPVRRGDGGTQPTHGLWERSQASVRKRLLRRITQRDAWGRSPAHCHPRRDDRGGAGRRAHRICGVGAPHCHTMTNNLGVT